MLPMEVQMKIMNIPYSNYKTELCHFIEEGQKCKYGPNCTFAHGLHELKKPYENIITPNYHMYTGAAFPGS